MNGGFVRSMIHQIHTASAQEASKTGTALPSMSVKMSLFQIARLAVDTSTVILENIVKRKIRHHSINGSWINMDFKDMVRGEKRAIQLSHQYLDSLSLVDLPPLPPHPALSNQK